MRGNRGRGGMERGGGGASGARRPEPSAASDPSSGSPVPSHLWPRLKRLQPRQLGNACMDYLLGTCGRSHCKFEHSIPAVIQAEMSGGGHQGDTHASPLPAHLIPKAKRLTTRELGDVCQDYLLGTCARQQCKFAHRVPEALKMDLAQPASSGKPESQDYPDIAVAAAAAAAPQKKLLQAEADVPAGQRKRRDVTMKDLLAATADTDPASGHVAPATRMGGAGGRGGTSSVPPPSRTMKFLYHNATTVVQNALSLIEYKSAVYSVAVGGMAGAGVSTLCRDLLYTARTGTERPEADQSSSYPSSQSNNFAVMATTAALVAGPNADAHNPQLLVLDCPPVANGDTVEALAQKSMAVIEKELSGGGRKHVARTHKEFNHCHNLVRTIIFLLSCDEVLWCIPSDELRNGIKGVECLDALRDAVEVASLIPVGKGGVPPTLAKVTIVETMCPPEVAQSAVTSLVAAAVEEYVPSATFRIRLATGSDARAFSVTEHVQSMRCQVNGKDFVEGLHEAEGLAARGVVSTFLNHMSKSWKAVRVNKAFLPAAAGAASSKGAGSPNPSRTRHVDAASSGFSGDDPTASFTVVGS